MTALGAAIALLLAAAGGLLFWAQEERLVARLRARRNSDRRITDLLQYTECILASITSGVIVVDTLGRITLVNQEAEDILGGARGELLGRSVFDVPQLEALPGLICRVRASSPPDQRSSAQHEIGVTAPGGGKIPLGVSVNALLADDGAVMGYVLVCRNLTETKAMLADIEHARKLTALGTVASGVAHNFNNILTTILGRVQILIRFPMTMEKVTDGLRIIEKSALDGAATVRRIQDYSKKEAPLLELGEVDVNEIVEDVVAFTRTRWHEQAREKGLTYEVAVETRTVPIVRGSSSELREVLINLMLNAVDAMPQGGGIRIRTDCADRAVRIVFVDDGPGMPAEVRTRIFDPFFTTKGRSGTGLGLFESFNIIQRHQGRLTCESEPGRGTTFLIELPAAEGRRGSVPPASSVAQG
jgi:PAS domain S-box-containing protein